MSKKLTGKELVIKTLEDSDEPMSCTEIFDTAKKCGYLKLYVPGTDNDQKKAQISSLLSTWSESSNDITKYEKGHNGSTVYTYSLNIDTNKSDEEEKCEECGELIDDCECYCEKCKEWMTECTCKKKEKDKEELFSSRREQNRIKREKVNEEEQKIDDEHFIPNSKLNNDKKYTKGKCGLYISDLEHSNIKINNKYVGTTTLKHKDSYGVDIKYKDLSSILKNNNGNLKIEGTKNCNTITFEFCITEQMYKESKGFHINLKEERIKQEREKFEKETQEKLEQERLQNERIKKEEEEKSRIEELEQQKERFRQENLKQERLQNNSYTPNPGTLPNPYGIFNNKNKDKIFEPTGRIKQQKDNGNKRITTRAKLTSGEIITWVELLRRCKLIHRDGAAASVEWLTYKNNDTEGRLPNVEVVDLNGNIIPYKEPRKVIRSYEKDMCWDRYFPKVSIGICPCCEEINITDDYFIAGHNVPVSWGGTNDIKNLVPICGRCNSRMTDTYTIVQFKEKYYPETKGKLLVE